jgi:sugar phosphate isomerase/epimerase
MKSVLTTTASLGALVSRSGQGACAAAAKEAGCSGLELRRELFGENIPDEPGFKELRSMLEAHELSCVYSAPVELWLPDGTLNLPMLERIVPEALSLGAMLVKTSLGHYRPGESDLGTLKRFWSAHVPEENALKLTVENDQTLHGGNVGNLKRFFQDCIEARYPIGMTFDIGNWNWTGEEAIQAAEALSSYVVYIHFKHVEKQEGRLVTLPLPEEEESLWRHVLTLLPQDTPRTIEFPVEVAGADADAEAGVLLTENLKHYAAMIIEA